MARLSPEIMDEIRQKADIVEIVKEYVNLEPHGKNYFGICPFHDDHTPSMSVSRERQMFNCFTCHTAGNVFKFVSEIENISYLDAVIKVGEKVGVHANIDSSQYKVQEKHEKEFSIMRLAQNFFVNYLNTEKGEKAREYLSERGLNEEMRKTFDIGLAGTQNSLHDFFQKKKISDSELFSLGLVNEYGLEYKDVFIDRIIFPIHDAEGNTVGFTGRVYEGEKGPKYLNSKETEIFTKGKVLFNYHRAKEAARKTKKLILVEGNMDAIRMYASGIENTVALMGTALTSDQISLMKRLRVPVVLMFDNDNAGEMATMTNGTILENAGVELEVVRLSGEKDPDEYILKNGVEAMQENINHAISFLDFKLLHLKQNKNLKDTKELSEYVMNVLESLKGSDAITIDITLNKLANEYQLSYDVLKNELEKKIEVRAPVEPVVVLKEKRKSRYEISAAHILYYMMNDSKYIKMYKNKLGFFKEETYRGIANEIEYYYEKNKTIELADFLNYAEVSPLKDEIYKVVSSIKEEDLLETSMEDYMNNIKEDAWQEKIKMLKQQMKDTIDMQEKERIAIELTEFMKKIQEIRKERSVKK